MFLKISEKELKYDLYGEGWADFSIRIEEDFSCLNNVIFTNGAEERCVWNLENDKKYMEKIQNVRLYETVSVSNENDYKTEMENAEFVYADEELLNRIQHPAFSDELYLSKGGGYLGVAELHNGEELYLRLDRHYDYYGIIGVSGHYDY